ncbi:MAG: glutamine synthetase family protein [Pseudomonadota bacterium]
MSKISFSAEIEAFVAQHGTPRQVTLLLPDMHGRMRAKTMPGPALEKLATGDVRLCWGTQGLNIWGIDVEGTGVGAEIGDPDGICRAVPGTLAPVMREDENAPIDAQVLITMDMPDGTPCFLDPRVRLQAVLDRFAAHGWTPVVALELEFYLTQPPGPGEGAQPPQLPGLTRHADVPQVYDADIAHAFRGVLNDIQAACAVAGVPTDGVIAEYGPGQFELNLRHCDDAARAADHAVLLRHVVRQVAPTHGLHATFMAKPYGDQVGSGCHLHVSVVDAAGENLFSSGSNVVSERLKQAIGGVLETAPDLTAIFAPHLNSYRRFAPGAFAPAQCNWALDHRDAAVRVPETTGTAARLEHRLAGADANPYLLTAAVLGGMLHGLENAIAPPEPIKPHALHVTGPRLTQQWLSAIEVFEGSDVAQEIFGARYRDVYAAGRRSEFDRSMASVTDFEYATYLTRI